MRQIVLVQLHSNLLVVAALKTLLSCYSIKVLTAQLLIIPFPQSLMKPKWHQNGTVVDLTALTMP